MKLLGIVNIFGILQVVTTAKRSGDYSVKQHFVRETVKKNDICSSHFYMERKASGNWSEGYEKLISGSLNITKTFGPISALAVIYKWSETSWKTVHAPIQAPLICREPYKKIFKSFLDHFDGKVNYVTCTIPPGKYTIRNWSIEPSLKAFSDEFPFLKCKGIVTMNMPGIKEPVFGMEVIFETVNKDLTDHMAKAKNKN